MILLPHYASRILTLQVECRAQDMPTHMKYLIRCRVRPRFLNYTVFRRYASNSTECKSYDTIVSEMESRSRNSSAYRPPRLNIPRFADHKVGIERYKPLRCGDLVLMNLEPFVVVKTPESPLHNYVIANRVGKAREVSLGSIDARLLTLLPESLFVNSRNSIYAPDDTVSASLAVIEGENSREHDLPQPVMRVVNSWLYSMISKPLSDIFEETSQLARRIFPRVTEAVQALQQPDKPVVMPFSEFVEYTLGRQMSVLDYYAVAMCMDHAFLRPSRLLKQSYLGIDAVQLLPKNSEARNTAALVDYSSDHSDYVREYAHQNLPEGDFESRAIELVRKKYPEVSYVDSAITAELLSPNDTFFRNNNWYHWIFNRQNASYQLGDDKLKNIRQEYSQPVYCVDELDAHEIDDGISLENIGNESVRLGIHIANPTSGLDLKDHLHAILPQCSSVYLHDETIKLLPEIFTTTFSLEPQQPKPALSLFVDFNTQTAELSNVQIKPLILTNIVCTQPNEFTEQKFVQVARRLLDRRIKNGMVTFKDYLQPQLNAIDLAFQIPGKAIVTEFMILANNLAAEYAAEHKIPLLFRTQNILLQSREIRQLYLNEVTNSRGLMDVSWRSVVRRSHVGVLPKKHEGMGVSMATRFTSPLRRVEDLVTHHQLESHLLKNPNKMFTMPELENVCERLLLSESIVKDLHRDDAKYVSLQSLVPKSQVLGVVLSVGSLHSIKIHLPQYNMDALYTGETPLKPYTVHSFEVEKASPAGGYAHVRLAH